MERSDWRRAARYAGLLVAIFVFAVWGSYQFGSWLDNAAYDFIFQRYQPQPWQTEAVLLAIDEETLKATPGGMHGIRKPLALALERVAAARPKAVALDVILADQSENARVDADLARAMCDTPNLVLSSEIDSAGRWEDPRPEFRRCAVAVGHVHAQPDPHDSRTRAIPLIKRIGQDRRWAIALEAYRLSRGDPNPPIETADDLEVAGTIIPVPDIGRFGSRLNEARALGTERRLMRVRFIPSSMAPVERISLERVIEDPAEAARVAGKVVFIGVTAQTESPDRLYTPAHPDNPTTGIEINAEAFETMRHGLFLTDVDEATVFLFSLALSAAIALAFRYLAGWRAYAAGAMVLALSGLLPYVFFTRGRVFGFAMPVSTTWLVFVAAGAHYYLVVRRNWLAEQSARARYQQAMHFVTHEMRTPLSAIQGSSELITRFAMTDDKRKQIAQLINSESKRLARMVEIFLNVERLSAGQMELKREPIPVRQVVDVCVERSRPLAARKKISIALETIAEDLWLTGDRELMEYACYNLLTNAIKYSPQRTEVTVRGWREGAHVRISVKDQGIGMDHKEVKQIFQKFYRTRKAEESGEAGTGIGLSIVQQIVEQHGGEIEVTSQPGVGSCFTLVLPARAAAPVPAAAEPN